MCERMSDRLKKSSRDKEPPKWYLMKHVACLQGDLPDRILSKVSVQFMLMFCVTVHLFDIFSIKMNNTMAILDNQPSTNVHEGMLIIPWFMGSMG